MAVLFYLGVLVYHSAHLLLLVCSIIVLSHYKKLGRHESCPILILLKAGRTYAFPAVLYSTFQDENLVHEGILARNELIVPST